MPWQHKRIPLVYERPYLLRLELRQPLLEKIGLKPLWIDGDEQSPQSALLQPA